jgi:signal transduction histidine kinase
LPEQRETLSKVLRNASSLMALIDDLLDLSKIEAGRLDVNPEEFQLLDCLHEALSQLEPQLKQKALKVEFDCSEDLWVKADFARTRQIVVNLLSNAVKFTAVGGVRLVARPVDQAIRLEVIDTGVGIANEHLELIFDEFRQADDRVSRTFGGTGLGLAIARKLALLQGGSLSVQSRLGEGSTFALQLPVAPTP